MKVMRLSDPDVQPLLIAGGILETVEDAYPRYQLRYQRGRFERRIWRGGAPTWSVWVPYDLDLPDLDRSWHLAVGQDIPPSAKILRALWQDYTPAERDTIARAMTQLSTLFPSLFGGWWDAHDVYEIMDSDRQNEKSPAD